ncbi:MAG: hypothetical protein HYS33_00250 [Acidobacteria bacterium]|nr:hypothetical protein [Acidobacteriota bacterium]
MLRHLADCSYCLSQVAELSRLQTEEVFVEVPPALLARARGLAKPATQGASQPLVRWGAIAAAAACLALVVATTYRRQTSSPTVTPSPPAALPITSSTAPASPPQPQAVPPRAVRNVQAGPPKPQLLSPGEGAVIAASDVKFRWKKVPGALYYEIRVVTEQGDVVWEGRAEETEAKLPPEVRLTGGQGFFVRVRAWLPEGKTVTSRVVRFRVKNNS